MFLDLKIIEKKKMERFWCYLYFYRQYVNFKLLFTLFLKYESSIYKGSSDIVPLPVDTGLTFTN